MPDDESLRFGALTVTGIAVDHSAPDARALLVEGDGRKLIYSGDLRAHGRTGFRFEKLLVDPRLRSADWLLLEGTTLGAGGDGHGLRSEQEVEEALVALATGGPDKAVVVVASGQNLDRLVSCYRAAKRTGRKLVVDPYQAFVLQKLAPLSENIPQFTREDVRVNFTHHQVEKLKAAGMMELAHEMGRAARVSAYALGAHPGSYLLCARGSWRTTQLLNRIGAANAELVWSMWGGYWSRDDCAVRKWAERECVQAHFIHSGGHAWPEDLERLVTAGTRRGDLGPHGCQDAQWRTVGAPSKEDRMFVLIEAQLDRAGGVLLGQAFGDALGVPYEFKPTLAAGVRPVMSGGGLGAYRPGEWSDDTQMALCIAQVAARANLASPVALDRIAERFFDWLRSGATDVGNLTRAVLGDAERRRGPAAQRCRQAAMSYLGTHLDNAAGNGALMRTGVVGQLDARRSHACLSGNDVVVFRH